MVCQVSWTLKMNMWKKHVHFMAQGHSFLEKFSVPPHIISSLGINTICAPYYILTQHHPVRLFQVVRYVRKNFRERNPSVMVAIMLDCDIVVREFKLQACYYIHFWSNALKEGVNPFYLPSCYELNSTTDVLLQECLWY